MLNKNLLNISEKLDVVAHTYDSAVWRLRQEGHEFKASLTEQDPIKGKGRKGKDRTMHAYGYTSLGY